MHPVSLSSAKRHLRVEHHSDDVAITGLIGAATEYVETALRQPLIFRTLRQYVDVVPPDRSIKLESSPVSAVVAVTGYGPSGDPVSVSPDQFSLDVFGESAMVRLEARIPVSHFANGLEIDFVAGLAETGLQVPDVIAHAIKTLVAHWYEFRGAETNPIVNSVPAGIDRLLAPYRRISL